MSSKTKKGLSYVLGDSNDTENHILPCNALQYSAKHSQLLSAGRDGAVKVWTPNSSKHGTNDEDNGVHHQNGGTTSIHNLGPDLHEDILKLETSIASKRLCSAKSRHGDFRITNNYNLHFDWINDMKLVANGSALVTCSSDLSLKLIKLASQAEYTTPQTKAANIYKFSNVHTDYIRKLTYNQVYNVITSGGIDGRMVCWDLQKLCPIQEIENLRSSATSQNSIYSLAGNSNLLGAGGPDNLINIYDRRIGNSSNFVRSLIGHQDNIKCLLMNDKFALSGSSDNTIKLWDLRNFKVYRNFEMHDSPVWSLCTAFSSSGFSNGENISDFNVFYSGDKNGNLFKTDLSYLSHHTDESYFPDNFTFSSNESSIIDEKIGISTYIAKSKSPIIALSVEPDVDFLNGEDSSLFASTGNTIERYSLPNTKRLAQYQHLRVCLDFAINNDYQPNDDAVLADGNDQNDIGSDLYDLVSHLSTETNNVDLQSSFSGNNYPMSVSNADNHHEDKDTFSLFVDSHGGPSRDFVNTVDETTNGFSSGQFSISDAPVEILLNPIPEEQVRIMPYNAMPINLYTLTHKSIISKRLFNNKRHILVLCSNGDIKIWDMLLCKVIKDFPNDSSDTFDLTKENLEKRQKAMDDILQKHQTMHTLNSWCDVEIKSGKLMVTLTETSFVKAEIYFDELVREYPFLSVAISGDTEEKNNENVILNKDDRFLISKVLLHSFFHQYELFEYKYDQFSRDELKVTKSSRSISQDDESQSQADSINLNGAFRRFKSLGKRQSKTNVACIPSSRQSPSVSEVTSINDGASTNYMPAAEWLEDKLKAIQEASYNSTDDNESWTIEDSIFSLLMANKKKYIEHVGQAGRGKNIASMLNIYSKNVNYETTNDTESTPYIPLINPEGFPNDLQITVFEYSSDLGNFRDLATFTLGEINSIPLNDSSAENSLVNKLRLHLPRWIGEPLLYDKFPEMESPKVSFQLLEYDYVKLPPTKKIGGKSQRKVKKLPVVESSIKLNSHNMLRVNKILTYLIEKFDSRTPEMKDRKAPSEWLVIECRDQELPLDMTLQTIKTRIWKSSSDIELRFRRRFDP